jgi:hypothetical protein
MKKFQVVAIVAVALNVTFAMSACQVVGGAPQSVNEPSSQESTEANSPTEPTSTDGVPPADAVCAAITSSGMSDAVGGELTILEPSEQPGISACVGYVDAGKTSGVVMAVMSVDGPAVLAELQNYPADQQDPDLGDGAWAMGKVIVMVSGNTQVSLNIDHVSGSVDPDLAKAKLIAFLDALGIAH